MNGRTRARAAGAEVRGRSVSRGAARSTAPDVTAVVARISGAPVPGLVAELLARVESDVDHLEALLVDLRYTLEHGSPLERHEATALALTLSRVDRAAAGIVLDALKREEARTAVLPGQLPAFEELEG